MSEGSTASSAPQPQRLWQHPAFAQGMREGGDFALGVAAWGLVLGVAMGNSGFPLWAMITMSLFVYAGTAQLAILPLMVGGAPLLVIWATAACVNLRFLVFSLMWRPYFIHRPLVQRTAAAFLTGDMLFAAFTRRYPEPKPQPEQWPYLWGGASVIWGSWQVSSIAGMVFADQVPVHWGLGFAGVLALMGLAGSLVKGPATALAGGIAGCAAVAAYALPLKLNIVVAIAVAVAAGLLIESTRPALAKARSGKAAEQEEPPL